MKFFGDFERMPYASVDIGSRNQSSILNVELWLILRGFIDFISWGSDWETLMNSILDTDFF
jgi:hypothetical protein